MSDWKKTTYRNSPPPDHLAEGEDWKMVGGFAGIVVMVLAVIALGIYGLFALLG